AGDQNDWRLHAGFLQIVEQFQAALAGHDHVGKNEVKMFTAKKLDGAVGIVANSGFVPGEAKSAGKRSQRVGIIVDQEEMRFAGQVGPLGALVRSRSQGRRRVFLGFGSGFARLHSWAGLALRQIDAERGAAAFLAGYGNRAVMIARSEEHTSELQSPYDLVCRLLLE